MRFRFRQLLPVLAVLIGVCLCGGAEAADRWKDTNWLPEGVSSYSKPIDTLFYAILALTGAVFIATEGILIYFMVRYRKKPGEKSFYTHGNHKLEMVWTIMPAIILIVIALVQARTWNEIKDPKNFADHTAKSADEYVHVQLFAEQFSWFFRYPAMVDGTGKDGKPAKVYKYGVDGTFTKEKQLVVPKGKAVIVEMTSKDVIHSFFLPYMRLKQDVVPGMLIRCWFDAQKTTAEMREDRPTMPLKNVQGKMQNMTWDYPIVCAELCGIQHYQMAGTVVVLEPKEYDAWLAAQRAGLKDKDGNVLVEEHKIFSKYWRVDAVTGERVYGETDESENVRTALKFKEYHAAHPEEKKKE